MGCVVELWGSEDQVINVTKGTGSYSPEGPVMRWQILIIPVLCHLSLAMAFEEPRQEPELLEWKCCGTNLGATVCVCVWGKTLGITDF